MPRKIPKRMRQGSGVGTAGGSGGGGGRPLLGSVKPKTASAKPKGPGRGGKGAKKPKNVLKTKAKTRTTDQINKDIKKADLAAKRSLQGSKNALTKRRK